MDEGSEQGTLNDWTFEHYQSAPNVIDYLSKTIALFKKVPILLSSGEYFKKIHVKNT